MRLRFAIRDLLWLTLVVALCAVWWFQSRRATPRYVVNEVGDSDAHITVLRDTQTGKIWVPVGAMYRDEEVAKMTGRTVDEVRANDNWVRAIGIQNNGPNGGPKKGRE
jgi:hypothetical protein